MIHQEKPEGFNPRFEVVSCFMEENGRILLLHRQDHKPEGNSWGVPAGKVDESESVGEAMLRELFQETGYQAREDELQYIQKVYVKYPTFDFIYHIYHLPLSQKTAITLASSEHKNYEWTTPAEALQKNLIRDLDACIKLFYKL
ncbi:MAG: NUDIX hydrolase [bacterium]|nr:NUDIX hydrolase [bacterium]